MMKGLRQIKMMKRTEKDQDDKRTEADQNLMAPGVTHFHEVWKVSAVESDLMGIGTGHRQQILIACCCCFRITRLLSTPQLQHT